MTKRRNPDLELVRGHNYCLPDQVGTDHQMTALGGDDTAMAPLIHAPDCDKCAKKQRQRGDGTVKQSVFMEEFRVQGSTIATGPRGLPRYYLDLAPIVVIFHHLRFRNDGSILTFEHIATEDGKGARAIMTVQGHAVPVSENFGAALPGLAGPLSVV